MNILLIGPLPPLRGGISDFNYELLKDLVKTQEQLYPGKKVKILLMTPAPNETFGEYETIFKLKKLCR